MRCLLRCRPHPRVARHAPQRRPSPASGERLRQRDPDAAVLLALLLDVGDRDAADLAGAAHMRAAAGLQVDAVDLDEPHAAGAARRLDGHGLDEVGIGVELLVGDPALATGRVAGDQLVELLRELALVEPGFGNVEVEPAVAVADGAARHRIGQHDAEQMQGRVDAHARVAPLPVEPRRDRSPGGSGQRRPAHARCWRGRHRRPCWRW